MADGLNGRRYHVEPWCGGWAAIQYVHPGDKIGKAVQGPYMTHREAWQRLQELRGKT